MSELTAVVGELTSRAVRPIVLKGAALAYTHYPHPCLRPREDFDLLVPESQKNDAVEALRARAYAPLEMVTGRLVTSQQTFARDAGLGVRHTCDLHWRVSNRVAFSRLLPWERLAANARPIPALDADGAHPAARAPDGVPASGGAPLRSADPHLAVRHSSARLLDERGGGGPFCGARGGQRPGGDLRSGHRAGTASFPNAAARGARATRSGRRRAAGGLHGQGVSALRRAGLGPARAATGIAPAASCCANTSFHRPTTCARPVRAWARVRCHGCTRAGSFGASRAGFRQRREP